MKKYFATIMMMGTVEIEADDSVNEWDIEQDLQWAGEQGWLDFESKHVDPGYIRATGAMVSVKEVE